MGRVHDERRRAERDRASTLRKDKLTHARHAAERLRAETICPGSVGECNAPIAAEHQCGAYVVLEVSGPPCRCCADCTIACEQNA